jgi:hypothetical protein
MQAEDQGTRQMDERWLTSDSVEVMAGGRGPGTRTRVVDMCAAGSETPFVREGQRGEEAIKCRVTGAGCRGRNRGSFLLPGKRSINYLIHRCESCYFPIIV